MKIQKPKEVNMEILKKCRLSGDTLKIIAVVSMVIDHVGFVFFPRDLIFRYVGRTAFPIYCFLLVEGFFHTCNIYRYLARMGIFAILSEIPFNLGLYHVVIYRWNVNVFFTLFLGLLVMYLSDLLYHRSGSQAPGMVFGLLGMMAAEHIGSDYGAMGILVIYAFYLSYRGRNFGTAGSKFLTTLFMVLFETILFAAEGPVEIYAVFSLIFILLYSGEKSGPVWKKLHLEKFGIFIKYFFYAVYPVHLIILWLIYQS